MNSIKFEWDASKATSNIKKHGVSFEEARTVFYDEDARLIHDPDHSEDEDRSILLGISSSLHVLIVCHCYRSESDVIRIISARKATNSETRAYENR
ncbi:MAG: BrnT family toxin [Methylotenera sp.]|nr:BrnT family toxin [Methylotenera sp.]